MLGHSALPPIDPHRPYPLTLGAHAFYWFSLEPQPAARAVRLAGGTWTAPLVRTVDDWPTALEDVARRRIEEALPDFLAPLVVPRR